MSGITVAVLRRRLLGTGAFFAATLAALPAQAALVGVCTGVSLPRSVVTGIIAGPLNGIATPVQNTVNGILTSVSVLGSLPVLGNVLTTALPGPLSIDVTGLLNTAASGAPITLQALDINGVVVGPADNCQATADSYTLDTPQGISIGGNAITGLGSGTTATAGSLGGIALGNGSTTSAAATNSVALGTNASATAGNSVALGAGSTATRGAVAGYIAPGLAAPQTSVGEVSVGTPGGERQITNVAAGSAPTDAVNVSQVSAAITASAAAAPLQYSNPGTPTTPNGGVPTNDTTLVGAAAGPVGLHNVADGTVAAGSTDAVNGGQLFTTNQNVATNTINIAGNTTSISNLTTGINGGTIGLVRQVGGSPGAGLLTVGAQTGGTQVSLTGTDGNRRLSGLLDGVALTDAATVGQLGVLGGTVANAVLYDTAGGVRLNSITLAGGAAGPVLITNVADGNVAAGSTDAVNGEQLFATNQTVATNTTNIAGNTLSIAGNTTAITNLTIGINTGTLGLVQQTGGAPGNGQITVGAATGGNSVSFAGTDGNRVLSNVADGVAASDAATVGQLTTVAAGSANAVQYDTVGGVRQNSVTLAGGAPGPVTVTNVAAGALNAGSTDAVNGAQLFATNQQVATNTTNITNNTTSITNLTNNINNGSVGLVQQTGGAPGAGQITVGVNTGGTSVSIAGTDGTRVLGGLSNGVMGSDAATVAQLASVTGGAFNAVQYDVVGGTRQNSITLVGGAPGPVTITNVADGAVAAGSTDAVNGGQLAATNAQVTANTTNILTNTTQITQIVNGQAGAFKSDNTGAAPASVASGANSSAGGFGAAATGSRSLALGNGSTSSGTNSVALGAGSTDGGVANVVSLGSVGGERRLTNVGPGLNGTDAVNLSQLQAATNSFTTTTNGLQNQINQLDFDLSRAKRRANAGTAGALAIAGLPQPFTEGAGMVAGGVGYWQGQVAFAVGVSKIVSDKVIVKAGASVSGRGTAGGNAGVGFQF